MGNLRYEYRATWSEEDDCWVGVCNGFLLVSHLASTEIEAFSGIRSLVADIVSDMVANGEPLPPPLSWDSYDAVRLDTVTAQSI